MAENTLTEDERGRVTLPKEYREEHGPKYRFIEVEDRLELIPVAQDPLSALREEFSKIPSSVSTDEVREDVEKSLKRETTEDIGAGR